MQETVTPYKSESGNKKQQVARMFDNIAGRYDFLNRFLSFGIDRYWRKVAVNRLKDLDPRLILDIATGTADLAIESLRLNPEKVFGVDISVEMLDLGRKKIKSRRLDNRIELLEGDSENLIFEDGKFDAVMVAFGVRNFENLEAGLKEIHRVLRPGGRAVILEFSKPSNRFFNGLYIFYSTKIAPLIGRAVSGDASAYTYLHESIAVFPSGEAFNAILSDVGFSGASAKPLTFGIVTVYCADKK
ncbi:MAG: bifunctional demethylmenaquinone methyltransferase/2-methoxy-6-polyprenyl-1,4-benzoquinol methylase UbiE [Bacteroidota bacterium]